MQKSFYFFCYVLICFFLSCSEDPLNSSYHIQINQDQLNSAFDSARNLGRVKCLLVSCQDTFYKAEFFLPGAETQTHDVMSVTKSVTSLLIGIAIDKGIIPSIDEPIDGYIRPLVNDLDSAKGRITIKQLLTMSCGLEWSEIPGPSEFMQWYTSPDKLLYIINKPFISVPGESFNYSDGAAHLASVVLSQATNMTANEFAQQCLFSPLGISDRVWTTDNRGFNYGGVRLFLFPDDMLRIGKLALNKGKWGNEQVVSEEWITESTGFQISTENIIPYGSSYGYYWWSSTANNYDFYYANGHGGQFIFIVPRYDLVIVATTNWSGLNDQQAGLLWYNLISIIVNEVLIAFN
ncbi:MAG: beta-lactamase family protein [Ignavibacteriaceae bacterium]|nr:beta-lactamase family protein [Ignavibacteriaceae bacterium]